MVNATDFSPTAWFNVEPSGGIVTTVIIAVLYGLYCYAVRPLNRIVRLGDLGFYFGDPKPPKEYEQMLVERMKKIRVLGELPPVFPNGWYCVSESWSLAPQQIKPVVFMGKSLTLLRGESGSVHLIDSYCPHLGASFNVGGRVVDENCVQCPFHGWIFSAETGKCTKIPYSKSIPKQAKVSVWPIVERNQHIYVWYHCDKLAPTWQIPVIPEIDSGTFKWKGKSECEILCHIQEIPENGADVAHLHYLHLSGINRGNDITKIDMENPEPYIKHVWNATWAPNDPPNQHIANMNLEHYMTLWGKRLPLTDTTLRAEQIGPGIVHMHLDFGIFGRGVCIQNITPEEPVQQRARFNLYAQTSAAYAKFFLNSEAAHFERDVYIWTNKRYIRSPLYAKDDGPINKHRRWYSQFYANNSPCLLADGTLTNEPEPVPTDELNSKLDW